MMELDALFDDLARLDELTNELDRLMPMIDRLHSCRKEHRELVDKIAKSLESRDLEAQGNFGFGHRMTRFLFLFRRDLINRFQKPTPRRSISEIVAGGTDE